MPKYAMPFVPDGYFYLNRLPVETSERLYLNLKRCVCKLFDIMCHVNASQS